ncbi:MAG: hypothetical protein J1E38_04160 [Paramuribaculum sp.]|nr:hypothetical protein [Paramuribaculum sp.]
MTTKTYILTVLFLMSALWAQALDWHDKLVDELLKNSNVSKTVVVERHRATHRIEKANYKFEFPAKDYGIAMEIREALQKQSSKALKFSIEGEEILMQVEEVPSIFYNYKLSKSKGKYLFLISVSKDSKPVALIEGDEDIKRLVDEIEKFKVTEVPDIMLAFEGFSSSESENDGKVYEGKIYTMYDGSLRVAQLHHVIHDSYGCPVDTIYVLKNYDEYINEKDKNIHNNLDRRDKIIEDYKAEVNKRKEEILARRQDILNRREDILNRRQDVLNRINRREDILNRRQDILNGGKTRFNVESSKIYQTGDTIRISIKAIEKEIIDSALIIGTKRVDNSAFAYVDPDKISKIELRRKSDQPNGDIKSIKLSLKSDSGVDTPLMILNDQIIDKKGLEKLQPHDIEEIIVLKNKEALDRYGTKAKDGVIILRTK